MISKVELLHKNRELSNMFYEFKAEARSDIRELKGHNGNLTGRVKALEAKVVSLQENLSQLREAVGIERPGYVTYLLATFNEPRDIKAFTLAEKVDAILRHLNLAEQATLDNKLVPAPKEEKTKEGK